MSKTLRTITIYHCNECSEEFTESEIDEDEHGVEICPSCGFSDFVTEEIEEETRDE